KVLVLTHIVIDPLADLARAVSFEAHPNFQAAKTAGLLESVYVVLITLVVLVELIGEIRRLHAEGCGEPALILDQHCAGIQRSIEPLVGIDGDGVCEFEAAVAHGPFVGQQHASAIGGIDVQPHAFAIGDVAEFGDVIDCAGIRGSEDAYNAHGADAIFLVLGNRGLESIEPNLKVRVGREGAQRIAAETDAIDSFIDRDVALLGCVHGPTIVDSVVLAVVAGDGVAPEFECDEVRHHAAAGEIAAGVFAVAAEVGEPAYYPPLHGNRRRADGICAYVLIDGRTDEVGDNTHGIRR